MAMDDELIEDTKFSATELNYRLGESRWQSFQNGIDFDNLDTMPVQTGPND
jgi:hypothetical protein